MNLISSYRYLKTLAYSRSNQQLFQTICFARALVFKTISYFKMVMNISFVLHLFAVSSHTIPILT